MVKRGGGVQQETRAMDGNINKEASVGDRARKTRKWS